jgi:hypothetical protein
MHKFAPLLHFVCIFRQWSAFFRELLDPSEVRKNTDRYGCLSHNVVKWPLCQSVVVQSVVLQFSAFRSQHTE